MAYVLLPLILIGFALLVVRPQQQRIKAQQAVVASLAVGDQVLSASGIFGTITELTDDVAVLQVADGVELRMARAAIARKVEVEDADGTTSEVGRHASATEADDDDDDPHPAATTTATTTGVDDDRVIDLRSSVEPTRGRAHPDHPAGGR